MAGEPDQEDQCPGSEERQASGREAAQDARPLGERDGDAGGQGLKAGVERAAEAAKEALVVERQGRSSQRDGAQDLDWSLYKNISAIAITAGASAPEVLVNEVIEAFAKRFDITIETATMSSENTFFPLPRELRENA